MSRLLGEVLLNQSQVRLAMDIQVVYNSRKPVYLFRVSKKVCGDEMGRD